VCSTTVIGLAVVDGSTASILGASAALLAGFLPIGYGGGEPMTDREAADRPIFRDDEPAGEGAPDPDIVPEGAARGGITVPDTNDTGITTPPISGWGDTLTEDGETEDE